MAPWNLCLTAWNTEPETAVGLGKTQRKFRVREWTPRNSPRIRTGATKEDQKEELKRTKHADAM